MIQDYCMLVRQEERHSNVHTRQATNGAFNGRATQASKRSFTVENGALSLYPDTSFLRMDALLQWLIFNVNLTTIGFLNPDCWLSG